VTSEQLFVVVDDTPHPRHQRVTSPGLRSPLWRWSTQPVYNVLPASIQRSAAKAKFLSSCYLILQSVLPRVIIQTTNYWC
jgi:hypothetical protein